MTDAPNGAPGPGADKPQQIPELDAQRRIVNMMLPPPGPGKPPVLAQIHWWKIKALAGQICLLEADQEAGAQRAAQHGIVVPQLRVPRDVTKFPGKH
jgi:hypothetical protein